MRMRRLLCRTGLVLFGALTACASDETGETIASGLTAPCAFDVDADGSALVWANCGFWDDEYRFYPGAVVRMTLGDPAPTMLATDLRSDPADINNQWSIADAVFDEASVYFAWNRRSWPPEAVIVHAAKDGSRVDELASVAGVYGLVRAGTRLYFTTNDGPSSSYALRAMSTMGGVVETLDRTTSGRYLLASHGSTVYWIIEDRLFARPETSGAPMLLATELSYPTDLLVDATGIYYLGEVGPPPIDWFAMDYFVARISLEGGPAEILASDLARPYTLASDQSSLYWAVDAGKIATVPKTGGVATILVSDADWPTAIVVSVRRAAS